VILLDFSLGDTVTIRLEDRVFPFLEKQFSYWKSAEELDHIDLAIERRGELQTFGY
jgi:hypothetical protein